MICGKRLKSKLYNHEQTDNYDIDHDSDVDYDNRLNRFLTIKLQSILLIACILCLYLIPVWMLMRLNASMRSRQEETSAADARAISKNLFLS